MQPNQDVSNLIDGLRSNNNSLIDSLRSFPVAESMNPVFKQGMGGQVVTGSMLQGSINEPAINTNLGNLKYAGQPDATKGQKGFAVFPSALTGAEALARDIQSKIQKNPAITLSQFIANHAPANENNTQKYISDVASRLSVRASTPISNLAKGRLTELITEIAAQEGAFGNGTERVKNREEFKRVLVEYALKGFNAGKQHDKPITKVGS